MAIADEENNSTLGPRVVSRAASKAEAINDNFRSLVENNCSKDDSKKMEYAWLEPRHDPIATDTNLAEIDFENFKNEDLAYAFSCGVSSL